MGLTCRQARAKNRFHEIKLDMYTVINKSSQVWDAYEIVTKPNKKGSKFHVATFITCIGVEALEVHVMLCRFAPRMRNRL